MFARRSRRRIRNVLRVCNLVNAPLGVIGQEDLAVSVGVVSTVEQLLRRQVGVGTENDETAVGGHVSESRRKRNVWNLS